MTKTDKKKENEFIKRLVSLGWRIRSIIGDEYTMEISMINRHYCQVFNINYNFPTKKKDIVGLAEHVTDLAIIKLAIETFKTK